MSAIKNFYFEEINSANADDFDYLYQQFLEENGLAESDEKDLFEEELPQWIKQMYK